MRRSVAAMLDELVAIESSLGTMPPWSLEHFTGGHVQQYAYCTDRSQWIHCMCARQTGKSWGNDGILVDNSIFEPDTLNVLLGLTGPAVRENNWTPVLKRILEKYGIEARSREDIMRVTLPNRSRILLAGTDDISHVRNALGNNLGAGVFIVDEAQDQPTAILDDLLDNILPPMMGPRSRVILSGVFPDVPAGRFWEESKWGKAARGEKSRFTSQHNWGRFANVHTPHARQMLDAYLEATGLTEDDPKIQRDWFGVPKFDANATGYMYSAARNGYHPELLGWASDVMANGLLMPPAGGESTGRLFKPTGRMMAARPLPWVRYISFAIDTAGRRDRVSVQGIGWGQDARQIQHLFDWTSEKKVKHSSSEFIGVLAEARRRFASMGAYVMLAPLYDAGSSPFTLDHLQRDFGLPFVAAAQKGSLKDGVDRMNTLFREAILMLMIGSAWEEDCQKARRDPKAAAAGKFAWHGSHHPDASEAGRYSAEPYFDAYKPGAPPKSPEDIGFPTPDDAERPWYERDMDALLGQ